MRSLLLLLTILLVAPAASAQWSFAGDFPNTENTQTVQNHGIAVDNEGKVWTQSYYPFTGDSVAVDPAIVANSSAANCSQATNSCRVTAIHVFNADGTPASFSPLSIVTLPGGERDTLGGGAILNGTGDRVWDYNTGRGLTVGPDGDVYASVGSATKVYRFDAATGEVIDWVRTAELDARGGTSPSLDANGNMYITGVFPGDPIAVYSPSLDYVENVTDADTGFNRTILVLPDGNTVFNFNYSSDITTVFQREDEFSAWDSTGVAFEGMSIESSTIHPTTGHIWVSAGSPNDLPAAPWQAHTWYAFDIEDALANPIPTPLDSLTWNAPGDGRPRAIGFTADGMTAYVGEFNVSTVAVQKFVQGGTAVETPRQIAGVELRQNRPNPFTGSTEITYSLDEAASVRLTVYDALGRTVRVLTDGARAAGDHTAQFDAAGLAGGVYTYALEINGQRTARRMLHMR